VPGVTPAGRGAGRAGERFLCPRRGQVVQLSLDTTECNILLRVGRSRTSGSGAGRPPTLAGSGMWLLGIALTVNGGVLLWQLLQAWARPTWPIACGVVDQTQPDHRAPAADNAAAHNLEAQIRGVVSWQGWRRQADTKCGWPSTASASSRLKPPATTVDAWQPEHDACDRDVIGQRRGQRLTPYQATPCVATAHDSDDTTRDTADESDAGWS